MVFLLLRPAYCLAADDRVNGPREMLEIMRIDDSQLRFIQDDRPVGEEERETVLQLLYRLPEFAQVDVEAWSKPLGDWQALVEDPAASRFQLFDLRGTVNSVRALEVLPELVTRLRFQRYYELEIESDEHRARALVRTIPQVWQQRLDAGNEIHGESIRMHALLLKRNTIGDQQGLVFAASRVNWYPTEPDKSLNIGNDQVLLGQLGVDVSRLEDVQHKQAITGHDRECFYQMLAAVRHAEHDQLARLGRTRFDIAKMIQRPSDVAGQLYTLSGRARRAVMIQVDDEDIQERFGIDHYFEIEVFLPLEKSVRFVDAKDPEGKLFTDFPFVICVPELPPGMETGDDIRVPISFSGFFLKLWAYRTEFMSSGQDRGERPRLQLSPLLIGPTVVPQLGPAPLPSFLGLGFAIAFVVALLAIWLILWRVGIQDRRFAKSKLYAKLDVDSKSLRSLEES